MNATPLLQGKSATIPAFLSKPSTPASTSEIIDLERPHYNLEYYEKVPVEELRGLADMSGVSECKDLDYALPYLEQAHEVLEIGGAYGRILDYAISHQLKAHFDVLEPSNQFYQYLEQHYNQPRFNIIQSCIEDFYTDKEYDVVLWLWSQINELSDAEILSAFRNLKAVLRLGGVIFIDVIGFGAKPLRYKLKHDDYFVLDMKHTLMRMTVLDSKIVKNFALAAGFSNVSFKDYVLDTGLKRTLITLQL